MGPILFKIFHVVVQKVQETYIFRLKSDLDQHFFNGSGSAIKNVDPYWDPGKNPWIEMDPDPDTYP